MGKLIENEVERRFATGEKVEIRAVEGQTESRKIGGYAIRYGEIYDMGGFTEEVVFGAVRSANKSELVALFNHDSNIPLGRLSAGTLKIEDRAEGLFYEIDLPKSPNGENVLEAVRRGDVRTSSWSWIGAKSDWERRDGKPHRKITSADAFLDVSPTTQGANPSTTVAKRSLAAFEKGEEKPIEKPKHEDEFLKISRARAIALAETAKRRRL